MNELLAMLFVAATIGYSVGMLAVVVLSRAVH
jgi:hypothetical protein